MKPLKPEITPEELAALEMPIPVQREIAVLDADSPRDPDSTHGEYSSAEHARITAYIRQDTRERVEKALLESRIDRSLSDLIDDLLREWLARR